MPVSIFETVANLGIVPLMALILLYWYRTDAKEREETRKIEFEKQIQEEKDRSCQEREDKILMITTLREYIEVLTELRTLVKAMNGKSGKG